MFGRRYAEVVRCAPLDENGEDNVYFCKGLIDHKTKYYFPFAGLWSGIMLGDLGRHGTAQPYGDFSKKYCILGKLKRQNITEDNKTQGIMEKSQWDLKHIRFRSTRLSRLDDFVVQYQKSHSALLKEYEDAKRDVHRKRFRVTMEKWKERKQKKKGRYVTAMKKAFPFKTSTKKYINAVNKTVFLVDPAARSPEVSDSKLAAQKWR
ncbi:uncharacterized protein LOC112148108 [Oryzias melastigma]|uniref:uncharacterized protein LOC112148108 n=1 Tax=Oryzias melastigma TaxID=30732 RepID=UPI000CF7EFBD|nr:uncharacterized protein LOC112148108 [Oryzias melastigma]